MERFKKISAVFLLALAGGMVGINSDLFNNQTYARPYSCTVTYNCGDGTISCTGTSSCSRDTYMHTVTCDGNTTRC